MVKPLKVRKGCTDYKRSSNRGPGRTWVFLMSVDICYVISHGFAARTVLHTGVIPSLQKEGLSIALITPNGASAGIQGIADRYGIEVAEAPKPTGRKLYFSDAVRKYITEDVRKNPALWAQHQRAITQRRANRKQWLIARTFYPLNRVSMRFRAVGRSLERSARKALANPEMAELLTRLQPRVLVSTYPVDLMEASLLHEAQRLGIPTVGQLLSWDNITSKGRFPVPPDYYISWGPIMTSETQEYYGTQRERVFECGVAHFDAHTAHASKEEITALVKKLGLNPDHPYLCFGMSSPIFCPHEIDVVEWLAKAVRSGVFGPTMQLVVRPHPQNVKGYMADTSWLPRLDALSGERVAIDYPTLASGKLEWSMDEADLHHLSNLLAGCTISLNSGSTLSIDAIIHDKPVIMTSFDAGNELVWWQSASRVTSYYHLAKLIGLGGVRVVRSFEELETTIKRYLENPGLDAAERARVRSQECGACDGHASERIASALSQIVATQTEKSSERVPSAVSAREY